MAEPSTPTRAPNAEDIPSWPDGAWAHLGEVWRRDFDWKSDDYEVVLLKDTVPLRELVILDELSSPPSSQRSVAAPVHPPSRVMRP